VNIDSERGDKKFLLGKIGEGRWRRGPRSSRKKRGELGCHQKVGPYKKLEVYAGKKSRVVKWKKKKRKTSGRDVIGNNKESVRA